MNHPPENRADDGDLLQPEQSPVTSPHAVSFGEAIRHHYYDNNGEQEKEQSSSSSDSDSDDDDFFQLEATELSGAAVKLPTAPVFTDNEIGVKYMGWKPPAAVRYDVLDPNLIPMSVFARSTVTATPKDWSVASNESLFSIQMGNSSFSRDQGLLMMGRSGDLGIFASETFDYPPPRPPPARAAEGVVTGEKAKVADVEEVKEDEELEAAMKEKATGILLSPSISRQSDSSSTTSFGSFAFPVLAGEEKSESIKVMAKHHAEHQPPPFINPLKVPAPPPAAAAMAARPPPSAMDLASAKRRWFPCFSWCQICC